MKRFIPYIVTLAVLAGGGAYISKNLKKNQGKDQNQYRIALVKTDTVKKTVSATGILTAWKTVDIKSRAGGRLVSLPVDEGSIVRAGQLIAQIDPSDTRLSYDTAQADIASNNARVDETNKTLTMQEQQTIVSIQTAQANVVAARASVSAARARLASARSQAGAQPALSDASIANAEATLAAERQKLTQLHKASQPQAVANAQAAVNQAKANLHNADLQLKRQRTLLDKGFVAQSAVDQAQATFEVAQANLLSTQEKLDTLAPEQDADIKSQEARVQQAEAALRTAKANRVDVSLKQEAANSAKADYDQAAANLKQIEARLRQAQAERMNNAIRQTQIMQARAAGARSKASLVNAAIQLKETRVVAPSDGIVLKKYVEQGTLITSGISFNSSGTSIIQMGDISRMYVDVQVDETDVASVDDGQKVDITFDAFPTQPFEGKVIKIQPQAVIDQNVTTVHVRVEVDNSATSFRLLKPGMNATCEFIVDKKEDVVAVPNEAVHSDDQGAKYVEIAQGGKPAPADKDTEADPNLLVDVKVIKKPIQTDLEGNDATQVTEGLKEGDRVITQTIEPAAPTSSGGNPFGGGRGPGRR